MMSNETKEFVTMLIEQHLDDESTEWNCEDVSKNSEESVAMVYGCLKAWKAINVDQQQGILRFLNEMILEMKMQDFGIYNENI